MLYFLHIVLYNAAMDIKYEKAGYLNSEFELFHITDSGMREYEFHYHDFYKVLIFLRGNVSYIIEGRRYELKPDDVVLVDAGAIHRPVINDETPYERIIAYVSAAFFDNYRENDCSLYHCFEKCRGRSGVIRPESADVISAIASLNKAFATKDYAWQLFRRVSFIEFMIQLNRSVLSEFTVFPKAVQGNGTILKILDHINANITADLTVDQIAADMYLSRSYLMHLFRRETGYTIEKYITEKRLFLAKKYIQDGMGVTDACYKSGFRNYSNFYHAFKKKYSFLPKASKDII